MQSTASELARRHFGELGVGRPPLYLSWKRGSIVLGHRVPEGHERTLTGRVPLLSSEERLRDWVYHEMQRWPCLPE